MAMTVFKLSSMRSAMREATSVVIKSTRPGTVSFTLATMILTSTLNEKKGSENYYRETHEKINLSLDLCKDGLKSISDGAKSMLNKHKCRCEELQNSMRIWDDRCKIFMTYREDFRDEFSNDG